MIWIHFSKSEQQKFRRTDHPGSDGRDTQVQALCVHAQSRLTQSRRGPQNSTLEKKMATHSSIRAWEVSWTERPGGLQTTRSQRVRRGLATTQQQTRTHTRILTYNQWGLPWRHLCRSRRHRLTPSPGRLRAPRGHSARVTQLPSLSSSPGAATAGASHLSYPGPNTQSSRSTAREAPAETPEHHS